MATNRRSSLPWRIARRVARPARRRYHRWRNPSLDLASIPKRLGHQPTVVLEIGANNGNDSVRLLEAFPSAALHCFEPDPRAIALLEPRLSGTRASLHRFAVGATDGTLTFHQSSGAPPGREDAYPEGWHYSGSIREPKVHLTEFPWCRFDSEITVDSTTLDSWAKHNGVDHVDFIWADVQGAERDLIEGGRELLARTRLLYTEYCNRELYEGQATLPQLLKMLPGWRVVHKYEWDVLLENTALRRGARRPRTG